MYESVSSGRQSPSPAAVDPVVTKAADYFAKTAKYEPPKVATFPLHGLGGAGITSLTGNS